MLARCAISVEGRVVPRAHRDLPVVEGPSLRFVPLSETFRGYLSRTPLAYAMFRSAECRELARLSIVRPTLDLGCGVGEVAEFSLARTGAERACDVGVDLLADRLAKARRSGGHAFLAKADAAELPLANASFASVVAVSVCEHFADPGRALAEAYRVLLPGGKFVVTIVLADFHRYMFYPRVCERLGLRWLARRYRRLNDHAFGHQKLQGRDQWTRMITVAGFKIVDCRNIVPPRLTYWFDFWLLTAWPYKLMQWLGMRPLVWRPKWVQDCCWRWFESLLDDSETEGSTLFVVAEKPGA
ncbi:MAG TPA: class I SAM-dependent methyltransferase [Pirellulales bacterium]|nr:class I SAM-dependent methyltransferase [Pirellulales bacterium]